MAETVWRASELPHPRKVRDLGLTPLPELKVRPPRIAECPAHLECVLDSCKSWGREVVIFDRLVFYVQDADVREGTWKDRYRRLGLFVCLEERLSGIVEAQNLEEEATEAQNIS